MDQDLLLSCMWSNISLTMGREEAQENLDTVVELLNADQIADRSEEHTSELQSRRNLVCRLLLEKKKTKHVQLHLIRCIRKPISTTSFRPSMR